MPTPGRQIETVADLIATLGRLSDRQRRGFGYWVDPAALLSGARSPFGRKSRAYRETRRVFGRLGDGTLTKEERAALRADAAEEACWSEGGQVAGRLADALERNDTPELEKLAPAVEWLREAALTGADRVAVAMPLAGREMSPGGGAVRPVGEGPRRVVSDFERGFRGPLWGYRGAALFGGVCALPFISKPSLSAALFGLGPAAAAFVVGFAWLVAMMNVIHWLGAKTTWSLRVKRYVLMAAVLAAPVTGLVILRITGG